jgi:hypothetical protein
MNEKDPYADKIEYYGLDLNLIHLEICDDQTCGEYCGLFLDLDYPQHKYAIIRFDGKIFCNKCIKNNES